MPFILKLSTKSQHNPHNYFFTYKKAFKGVLGIKQENSLSKQENRMERKPLKGEGYIVMMSVIVIK